MNQSIIFQKQVHHLIAQHPHDRIVYFTYEDRGYWLKNFSVREVRHIFKPDPQAALQQELHMLQTFREKGIPVPAVVWVQGHHIVLEDVGTTLNRLLPDADQETRQHLLSLAVTALASLHEQDIVHGRPAIRDLVYDGKQIWFIDFENIPRGRSLAAAKNWDLCGFWHSLFRESYITQNDAQSTLDTYARYSPKASTTICQWRHDFRHYYPLYRFLKWARFRGKDAVAIVSLFDLLYAEPTSTDSFT